MTTPTDLIAQAEAVMEGVTPGNWAVTNGKLLRVVLVDGQKPVVICGVHKFGKYGGKTAAGAPSANARFIAWCRAGVPALIARIRELEGERDGARKANREMLLEVIAASGQAQEAYQAQLAAEATVATLTAQVEAMRGALLELVTCVDDGCLCSEMKMATAIDRARAALTTENQTNG